MLVINKDTLVVSLFWLSETADLELGIMLNVGGIMISSTLVIIHKYLKFAKQLFVGVIGGVIK